MRVLVTGALGMLGRAVVSRLSGESQVFSKVVGVDLADGDLTQPEVVEDLIQRHDPQWVIHCAAWTDVDGAETSQEQAMTVNRDATANLVSACGNQGCGLTYISTDYVFNGEGPSENPSNIPHLGYPENYQRDPVNYYGQTKAAGEQCVEAMNGPWQIVRISWLFGEGPVNFPQTIRRLLGERETLRVVNDQLGCPTFTEDLAGVLTFLVSERHHGIFHVTNAGACTWYEFAQEVARLVGTDPERIVPCPSSEYPTPATRPRFSVLNSSALERVGCPVRPTWQDALGRYLQLLSSGD